MADAIDDFDDTRKELYLFKMLFACARGNLQVMQQMVRLGASVNAGDYDSRTPIMLAAAAGSFDIVRWLVENGADVNARDRFGHTAIDDSIRLGHKNVTSFLVANGANAPSSLYEGKVWFLPLSFIRSFPYFLEFFSC